MRRKKKKKKEVGHLHLFATHELYMLDELGHELNMPVVVERGVIV